jgi:hypothetical protein
MRRRTDQSTHFLNGHCWQLGSQLGQCLIAIVGDGHDLDERFDFRSFGPTRPSVAMIAS